MTEQEAEDKFYGSDGASEEMSAQITQHIRKHRSYSKKNKDQTEYQDLILFSAYSCKGKDAYTNNLYEVAVEGRIKIKTKHSDFFGSMTVESRKNYESEIMENPTWLDICLCANDMINCTGDNHHIFLEGVHNTGSFTLDDESFILLYDFSMGS